MARQELYELFAKKESGKITDSELARLESVLKSKENRDAYDRLKEAIDKKDIYSKMKFDYKKSKERVISEIRKYEPGFSMGGKTKSKTANLNWWIYRVAAILVIAIAIGSVIIRQAKVGHTGPEEVAYQYFSTQPGENLKLTLTDGSFIQLNGGSSIRFIEHFSGTKREVWVTGEAYCKIAKDKKRPFVVNLGDYKVEVLGTTFNVNAYKKDKYMTVALVEGKVKVYQAQGDSVFLNPGKMLSINKQTDEYAQSCFDINNLVGWKDKIFVFDNAPLTEVFNKLERRYGVTFETGGINISKIRINATFEDEPLPTILKAMEYGTELTFGIQDNNKIKLSNK